MFEACIYTLYKPFVIKPAPFLIQLLLWLPHLFKGEPHGLVTIPLCKSRGGLGREDISGGVRRNPDTPGPASSRWRRCGARPEVPRAPPPSRPFPLPWRRAAAAKWRPGARLLGGGAHPDAMAAAGLGALLLLLMAAAAPRAGQPGGCRGARGRLLRGGDAGDRAGPSPADWRWARAGGHGAPEGWRGDVHTVNTVLW